MQLTILIQEPIKTEKSVYKKLLVSSLCILDNYPSLEKHANKVSGKKRNKQAFSSFKSSVGVFESTLTIQMTSFNFFVLTSLAIIRVFIFCFAV